MTVQTPTASRIIVAEQYLFGIPDPDELRQCPSCETVFEIYEGPSEGLICPICHRKDQLDRLLEPYELAIPDWFGSIRLAFEKPAPTDRPRKVILRIEDYNGDTVTDIEMCTTADERLQILLHGSKAQRLQFVHSTCVEPRSVRVLLGD